MFWKIAGDCFPTYNTAPLGSWGVKAETIILPNRVIDNLGRVARLLGSGLLGFHREVFRSLVNLAMPIHLINLC